MPKSRAASLFPIRAVIDACVFPYVETYLIPITDAARDRYVSLYWSPSIIAEANRVLTWRWIKRHGGDQSAAA